MRNDQSQSPCRIYAKQDAQAELQKLTTPDGVFASGGKLFHALFGRDSAWVALLLCPWYETLSRLVIMSLARFQGTKTNHKSEEEPGKIAHEMRAFTFGGKKVALSDQLILRVLRRLWGGTNERMLYYGSVDATVLFVWLVAEHCQYHGTAILHESFEHHTQQTRTIWEALLDAVMWMEHRIENSAHGLIESIRHNRFGLACQTMRDSPFAYLHANGELVNLRAPIASFEVQAYAVHALELAARLLELSDLTWADSLRKKANQLRSNIFQYYWMNDQQAFAMAMDRDPKTLNIRQVQTVSSVNAEVLQTSLFDPLEETERNKYVHAIINHMQGTAFRTPVGIRMRALKDHQHHKFSNTTTAWYHGEFTSWPINSAQYALGAARQGYEKRASLTWNQILRSISCAGEMMEYFLVDGKGSVAYTHSHYDPYDKPGFDVTIRADYTPQPMQAWTIAAVLRALEETGRMSTHDSLLQLQETLKTSPHLKLKTMGAKLQGGLAVMRQTFR